jgi:hypothetical protein
MVNNFFEITACNPENFLMRLPPPYNQPGFHRAVTSALRMACKSFEPVVEESQTVNRRVRFRPARLQMWTLASVCGRRAGKVKRRRSRAHNESQPERNVRRRLQTEAGRCCGTLRMLARDERAVCGV